MRWYAFLGDVAILEDKVLKLTGSLLLFTGLRLSFYSYSLLFLPLEYGFHPPGDRATPATY